MPLKNLYLLEEEIICFSLSHLNMRLFSDNQLENFAIWDSIILRVDIMLLTLHVVLSAYWIYWDLMHFLGLVDKYWRVLVPKLYFAGRQRTLVIWTMIDRRFVHVVSCWLNKSKWSWLSYDQSSDRTVFEVECHGQLCQTLWNNQLELM